MKRKICVVTGSRAEYGLLKKLLNLLKNNSKVELQLIVTGSHLSTAFGNTYKEIENDNFKIDKKVEILLESDSNVAISKSMGLANISFSEVYQDLKPDLIFVVGDRYEIFAACAAAMISRIPIAHCHGGEATEGLIDEAIRHSITKMSQIHFAANNIYRNRIIQLGESPKYVFSVGGLGVDSINKTKLLSRKDIEEILKIKLNIKNLLISFHPETLKKNVVKKQINQLLNALSTLRDTTMIFTCPGLDYKNKIIVKKIKIFIKTNSNAYYFPSLGQINYFSILNIVDAIVGNSSSGILEMPTFKKPTINIGDRQLGRLKSTTVIDCKIEKKQIINSLKKIYSKKFKRKIKNSINPYGSYGASVKIVKILKKINLKNIMIKKFYDIK
jgi:GDP/UDP-N,N'-diacetylbacillosamine 2-epimerase (hydrolysing)